MSAARPRRLRAALAILVVLLIAWLIAATLTALAAKNDAQSGADLLQRTQTRTTPAQLLRGLATRDLRAAQHDLERASQGFGSPLLAPAQILPVLGRQLRTVKRVADSATKVVRIALVATNRARAITGDKTGGPAHRVATAQQLGSIARDATAGLRKVDSVEDETALIGSVGNARDRFVRALHTLRSSLYDIDVASTGLATFLQGPTHYLVFAANNAEMRAGAGMLLSVGVLTVQNGSFSLDQMRSTDELTLTDDGVPIADRDLAARWGWAQPNREWRNLLLSPNFPASAQLASAMWQASTGQAVDGVLVIDPLALRALLQTTGPVEVDGRSINAANVVDEALHRQYLDVANDSVTQAQRRERLGTIAQAAVSALERGGWETAALLDNLQNAAQGRHIMAWSSAPAMEHAWTAAGIDGRLGADSLLPAILNTGANKLDQFLVVKGNIASHRQGANTRVEVRFDIENITPTGEPRYVQGPNGDIGLAAGEYKGLLSLDVPKPSRNVQVLGGGPMAAAGSDGANYVVAAPVKIARGQRLSVTVTFDLPAAERTLNVQPSARQPVIHWTAGNDSWTDAASHQVELP